MNITPLIGHRLIPGRPTLYYYRGAKYLHLFRGYRGTDLLFEELPRPPVLHVRAVSLLKLADHGHGMTGADADLLDYYFSLFHPENGDPLNTLLTNSVWNNRHKLGTMENPAPLFLTKKFQIL